LVVATQSVVNGSEIFKGGGPNHLMKKHSEIEALLLAWMNRVNSAKGIIKIS
jgi:hypothetical protein